MLLGGFHIGSSRLQISTNALIGLYLRRNQGHNLLGKLLRYTDDTIEIGYQIIIRINCCVLVLGLELDGLVDLESYDTISEYSRPA